MKVLAISASPRAGGNSDLLCDEFLVGAAGVGHQTEKLRLAEYSFAPCSACYGCAKTHRCVKQDAMGQIQQKLIDADVIALATPVYFYSMAAQLKLMIDRCLPRYREMQNKVFYFIVTAAAPDHSAAGSTLAGMRGFLRCLPGAKEAGVIYGTGAWDKGDILRHPALQQARQAGAAL